MAIPFLATKFFIPTVHRNLVARLRLLNLLDDCKKCKLTLISAPAGSGKTTIFCQWHLGPGSGTPVAWLSLDPADNDPAHFLQCLAASLDAFHPGVALAVESYFQTPNQPNWEAILTLIINNLSNLEDEAILALDDYHLVENPTIHKALAFLLDNLPPKLHLVLLSRADPPFPLARLRARDQMVEVRAVDLRFTMEETTLFLNRVMRLDLTPEQVLALEKRTEGWITGLQLAALSMQGHKDVQGFISAFTGSNHYIVDYLAEEVLAHQPEALRQFLLKTSILEQFCGPLCNALTGDNNGSKVLTELERLNLFVIPLDDEHYWYRYHHLFADILRLRLEHSQPGLITDLHHRASIWFEEQKLVTEAVAHSLKGKDTDRAARLVEQNMMVMIGRGHLGSLLEWISALPPGLVSGRPWLSIARAWALAYTGGYDDATECLVDAAQALEEQAGGNLAPEEADRVRGHIYAIRCYMLSISNQVEPDEGLKLALKALDLLPASDGRTRGLVSVLLSVGYRQKMDFTTARESLERALEIARAEDQNYVIIDLLSQTALVYRDQGRFHHAETTCREVLRLVDEYGSAPPVIGYALCTLSEISFEWNNLSAASEFAQQALDLGRKWGSTDLIHGALYSTAMTLVALRQFDRALEIIGEMKRLYIPTGHYPRFPVAVEALTRIRMGDPARANQCAADLVSQTSEKWRMEHLMQVYIALFREGLRFSLDDVMDSISKFLPLYESASCPGGVVNALVCRAMTQDALGQREKGVESLRQALAIAEPEGYVRSFIDHGLPMKVLLDFVMEADRKLPEASTRRRVEYVNRLLNALKAEKTSVSPAESASPELVEQLSTREVEVLNLLAQGCSDKQIAASLVIARETVHKHLKNIYGKLGVHNRTEATARARQLGLL